MTAFRVYADGKEITDEFLLRELREEEVGVFETMRLYDGRVFCEHEHLRRFLESAKTVGCPFQLEYGDLKKELRKAVDFSAQKDGIVRLTLVGNRLFVIMRGRKFSEAPYRKGIALRTSPVRRVLSNAAFPEAKSSAYQNAWMASLERGVKGDATEWLFLDVNGYVTETRTANIFIVMENHQTHKKELVTPPALGVLNGVTRRFVIKCAVEIGMAVVEKFLTRHDAFNAAEIFLTNTSWEILPVRNLDGRQIGTRVPGPQTIKLCQIFKRKVVRECQTRS